MMFSRLAFKIRLHWKIASFLDSQIDQSVAATTTLQTSRILPGLKYPNIEGKEKVSVSRNDLWIPYQATTKSQAHRAIEHNQNKFNDSLAQLHQPHLSEIDMIRLLIKELVGNIPQFNFHKKMVIFGGILAFQISSWIPLWPEVPWVSRDNWLLKALTVKFPLPGFQYNLSGESLKRSSPIMVFRVANSPASMLKSALDHNSWYELSE